MTDHFTYDSLRETLATRPFKFAAQVSSTQDIAQAWALDDDRPAPQGAVVICEEQTVGRGRQGRKWIASAGNSIMFSTVLRPVLPPEHVTRCTMAGGLAVADVVAPLIGDGFALKWPNDALVRGKKLCGILAEAVWLGDDLAAVILGIGLNVRTDFNGLDFAYTAASLEVETGHVYDRHELLRDLLTRLDHWAAQVADAGIVAAWRTRLGTLGKRVTVTTSPTTFPSPTFEGVAEDVDEAGALLVRLDDGELRRVVAADVGLSEP